MIKTTIIASTRAVCALARLARGGSPTYGIEQTTSARRFGLILIVTAFTGLYMNLPSVLEPALAAVAPVTDRHATAASGWRSTRTDMENRLERSHCNYSSDSAGKAMIGPKPGEMLAALSQVPKLLQVTKEAEESTIRMVIEAK